MSPNISRENAEQSFKTYATATWVSSSDAHRISEIGQRTTFFYMKHPTLQEMKLALEKIDGRKVEWR